MEKDVILERLLATEEYKARKKHAKKSALLMFPIVISFFALSWIVAKHDLLSLGSIIIYLCTFLCCYCLKVYIKAVFLQKVPIYHISVIKQIRKITRTEGNFKFYRMEYLVTINGEEVWAKDNRGLRDSNSNRFDCSSLQVGHSVIVFKLSPNSLWYIVSNE